MMRTSTMARTVGVGIAAVGLSVAPVALAHAQGWVGSGSTSQEIVPDNGSSRPVIVTMPIGTIHVVGTTGDSVTWRVIRYRVLSGRIAGVDVQRTVAGDPGGGPPSCSSARPGGSWVLGHAERAPLHIDIPSVDDPTSQTVTLCLTVPHTLTLLNLTTGGGEVSVSGFDGDLVVKSDSGGVYGEQLGGPVVVEARNGEIDVGVVGDPRHAISLLAHNGGIRLAVPAAGKVSRELTMWCAGTEVAFEPNGGSAGARAVSQTVTLDSAFGISSKGETCGPAFEPVNDGRKSSTDQFYGLNGFWGKSDIEVSLRTQRGTIVIIRR